MLSKQPCEINLSVNNLTIRGLQWGPQSAPPIVALHGWLDNAASFIPLAEAGLGSYRLLALDLPGHGLSDHIGCGAVYHFVDWVSVVIRVANALALDRFTLMGHSMGAGIATLVAGTFPDRVHRAIFLEGLGPLTSLPEEGPENLREHIVQGQKLDGAALKPYASKELAEQVLMQATGIGSHSARALVHRGMVEGSEGGFYWRSDPRMRQRSAAKLTETQVLAFIKQIRSPSILIKANDGLRFDREATKKRVASLKGLEVVELDGNHHVHMEKPVEVSSVIKEFLSRYI